VYYSAECKIREIDPHCGNCHIGTEILNLIGWLLCLTATDITSANEIQDWSQVLRSGRKKLIASAGIEPATSHIYIIEQKRNLTAVPE
jgi:hypothetical protein